MMDDTNKQAHDVSFEALMKFARRYRADAGVRARVDSGDYSDLDAELPQGLEVRVMQNTADTFYFLLPPDTHSLLSDQALESVAGGSSYSAGCMACTCILQSALFGPRRW